MVFLPGVPPSISARFQGEAAVNAVTPKQQQIIENIGILVKDKKINDDTVGADKHKLMCLIFYKCKTELKSCLL